METEHDRLRRLYAELGDEHLQDLADQPEDLTDEARLALSAELRGRGLIHQPTRDPDPDPAELRAAERESGFGAGIPGLFPSGAATVEQALEPAGETRLGWSGLVSFYDGLELSRACDALDDADTDFAIEEKAGDALSGAPASYEIWVRTPAIDHAQRVLREKLGLFPLPEVEASANPEDPGPMPLGSFASAEEANAIYHLLRDHALTPTLTEPTAEDEESWWTIEVPAPEHTQALDLVSKSLEP